MIYFTGDIHGEVFRVSDMIQRYEITISDTIVLLGDVGMNYYGNKRGDRRRKKRLNQLGVPILCIHGNHEMRPGTIPTYHEVEWNGGAVYVEDEYPNLLFAKDGEVYDLEGLKAIAIGGAYSIDKWYRLQCGAKWFADEQPSEEIKRRVEDKLMSLGWKIDTVLTHTCPARYITTEAFIPGLDQSTVDNSTELWLDMLCVETACEIGINACIDILGREFVIAHRESGTAALGVCEDGVFCFIGIETDAPSQNTDNTLVLDSTSAFTHQASCFVRFIDGEITFR